MEWKKALAFYVEIIVWVAIWGLVVHIGEELAHTKAQVYTYYILVAIFGSLLLYYLVRDDDDDDE